MRAVFVVLYCDVKVVIKLLIKKYMYVISKKKLNFPILLLGAKEISHKEFKEIAKKHIEKKHKIFVELDSDDYYFVKRLLKYHLIPTHFKRIYDTMYVIDKKKIYKISF